MHWHQDVAQTHRFDLIWFGTSSEWSTWAAVVDGQGVNQRHFDHALSGQRVRTRSVVDDGCELWDRTDRQMDRPAAPQYVSVTHRDCCFYTDGNREKEWPEWVSRQGGIKKKGGGDKQKGGKNRGQWSKCWNSRTERQRLNEVPSSSEAPWGAGQRNSTMRRQL